MFCYNCGAQMPEDATFCGVCGSKIFREVNKAVDQQVKEAETNKEMENTEKNVPPKVPKRKIEKLPLILGIAVLVVIAVIVVAVNWTGKVDYVATVGAHAPLAESLPYTYKEVLEKYLDSPEWTLREEGDEHYVDISGATKGTGHHLTVTIKVTPDPDDSDRASIAAEKVKYDEIESASSQEAVYFLSSLFYAYDAGYEDLAELGLFDELSAAYTNEAEGISFQYPDTWTDETAGSAEDGGYVVSLVHMVERDATLSYGMEIRKFPDSQNLIDNMFMDDEEFTASFMSGENELSVLNTEMGELSGVPARLIEYVGADGVYYKSYIYGVHSTLYWVDFMCMKNQAQIFDDLFDAIISSYVITADSLTDVNEPLGNYGYLSGFYAGNLYELSTLSIGIYTSQEEGETAIGGANIYVTDGEYYYYNYGLIYVVESGIYMVETETEETVMLYDAVSENGDWVLQLYVDGYFLEEYRMTEHYEP